MSTPTIPSLPPPRARKGSARSASAAAKPPPWRDTMLRSSSTTGHIMLSAYASPHNATAHITLSSVRSTTTSTDSSPADSYGLGIYVELIHNKQRFLSSILPTSSSSSSSPSSTSSSSTSLASSHVTWDPADPNANFTFNLSHTLSIALIKSSSPTPSSPAKQPPSESDHDTDLLLTVWAFNDSSPPLFVGHAILPMHTLPSSPSSPAASIQTPLGKMSVELLEYLSHSIMHLSLPDHSKKIKNTRYHQVVRGTMRAPIPLPDPLTKRDNIVFEIYTTEVTYVNGLTILAKELYGPLVDAVARQKDDASAPSNPYGLPPMIPATKLKLMAANIEFLLKGHTALLDDLEGRISRWSSTTPIGDLFTSSLPLFTSYSQYCAATELALSVLNATEKASSQFFAFDLQSCRYHGGSNFRSLVILPVQRLPRYRLLLADLVKATPKQHPDGNNLSSALSAISKVANNINSSLASIGDIKSLKKAGVPHFFAPGRTFIHKAPLSPRSHQPGWYGVLCSDVLLVGFQESKRKPLDVHHVFALPTLWVKDLAGLDPQSISDLSFEVYTCIDSLFLYAESAESKEQWISELYRATASVLAAAAAGGGPPPVPTADGLATRDSAHFYYPDGSIYMGTLCRGEAHGSGTLIQANGDQYDGEWYEGMRHGTGRQSFASPTAKFALLEGEFFHDVFLSTTTSAAVAMPVADTGSSIATVEHLSAASARTGTSRALPFVTPESILKASKRNPLRVSREPLADAPDSVVASGKNQGIVLAASVLHIQAISPSSVPLEEGGVVLCLLKSVNGNPWYGSMKADECPVDISVLPEEGGVWEVALSFRQYGVYVIAIKNGSHITDVLSFDIKTRTRSQSGGDEKALVSVTDITFPFRQKMNAYKKRPPPKPSQPPRSSTGARPTMAATFSSSSSYYSYYSSSSSDSAIAGDRGSTTSDSSDDHHSHSSSYV